MERIRRKPFQGVLNIIRFNWHFFVIAFSLVSVLLFLALLLNFLTTWLLWISILISIIMLISLFVSFYIYDYSDFYSFDWLRPVSAEKIVNIHAGFDETTAIIRSLYPNAQHRVMDFYNPLKHTEISIERARNLYPSPPTTELIATDKVPLEENSVDVIFLIFAAHEIRSDEERVVFLKSLKASIKPTGKIIIVEHLRDFVNFLGYNVGFFHFLALHTWIKNFDEVGLVVRSQDTFTPFVKIFELSKNGNTY
ncbi:MAG: methyltransferase domain-containing protein [Bacteroidetes bacterium]|nr:methyltransferase domain-containing protein [Bacteroidota bacterium]